jgi:hypothetical protein
VFTGLSEVTAEVVNVVYFSKLDVDAPRPDGELMRYLCFGRPGHLFLAHRIEGRPSFDHVVFARMVPGTVTNQAGSPLDEDVTTIGYEVAQPVPAGRLYFCPLWTMRSTPVMARSSGVVGELEAARMARRRRNLPRRQKRWWGLLSR